MPDYFIPTSDNTTVPTVCIVTSIPSPYQVELFDEITRRGEINLRIIYLRNHDMEHPWKSPEMAHDNCILDASFSTWQVAWKWCQTADLTVFSYYTHPFPFFAMRCRALRVLPWVFWGERPGSRNPGQVVGWIRRKILHPLKNRNIPIWGVGQFALERYRKDWGPDHRYVNFPYFSNLERFGKQPSRKDDDTFVILYSGLFNRRKNVLGLAREFIACSRDHPKARLWLLGSGPLETQLRNILAPVADKVRWLGFQSWNDLPAIYAQANILCHPTHYDGWALVVVEALSSGLPVIATQTTGAAHEFIKEGVNGWLIPANDGAALQNSLRRALALPANALTKMSVAAKASMGEHCLPSGAKRFVAAAHEALSSPSATIIRQTPAGTPQNPLAGIHVILASNYAPDHLYSMERYAKLLENGLRERGVTCTFMKPATILGNLPWIPVKVAKYLRYLDKYLFFPLALRWKLSRLPKSCTPIIHITDQGNSVFASFVRDYPVMVTCHDLIAAKPSIKPVRQASTLQKRSWFQRINFKALQRAEVVVCDSEKTKQDCEEFFDCEKPRPLLSRVYIPLDPDFMRKASEIRASDLPASFLLHVGNSSQYKNRPGLLRIYAALRKIVPDTPPLVIMGEALLKEELALIDELALETHLHHFTKPSDEMILQAYQHAEALIFPSLEEGFGWPVLEAMACGCPVFTSNRAPMTEVGGDAAEYFDPEDIEGAARLIADRLAKGTQWRIERVQAGQDQIKKFSQEAFITSMIEAYGAMMRGML